MFWAVLIQCRRDLYSVSTHSSDLNREHILALLRDMCLSAPGRLFAWSMSKLESWLLALSTVDLVELRLVSVGGLQYVNISSQTLELYSKLTPSTVQAEANLEASPLRVSLVETSVHLGCI